MWKKDKYNASVKAGLSKSIRLLLVKEKSGKCYSCGWSAIHPVTGNWVIEVNHIDGNYLNNSPSNIELLCPNCHALTENYRALNIGNGRPRYDK